MQFPKGSSAWLFPVIKALPQTVGTVRRIRIPEKPSGRIILHIQDVHRNPEAQANIARAVQILITQKKVDLVALEGAFGPMDFSWYHRTSSQNAVKAVANYLLKEQRISGPVHTAFVSAAEIPPFVGVDQKQHYDANIKAYQDSVVLLPIVKKAQEEEIRNLAVRKRRILRGDLAAFDQAIDAYRAGRVSWGDHVRFLSQRARRASRSIEACVAALDMEKKLNFQRVEQERIALLTRLVPLLTPAETRKLVLRSAAFRAGEETPAIFYSYLKDLCAQKNLALATFPALNHYLRYIFLADRLEVDDISFETATLEKEIYKDLCRTTEERNLIQTSRRLYLTGKLLTFALNKREWDEYKEISKSPFSISKQSRVTNSFENWKLKIGNFPEDLSTFQRFYEEAEARDLAMAQNLGHAMEKSNANVVVLVTGGFHADGLSRRLQANGATVVSFVPKIRKIEDVKGTSYLSVFAQEKTPLDKLFAGEKLFVAPLVCPALKLGIPAVLAADQAIQASGGIATVTTPEARITVEMGIPGISDLRVDGLPGQAAKDSDRTIFPEVPFQAELPFAAADDPHLAAGTVSLHSGTGENRDRAAVFAQKEGDHYSYLAVAVADGASESSAAGYVIPAFFGYFFGALPAVRTEADLVEAARRAVMLTDLTLQKVGYQEGEDDEAAQMRARKVGFSTLSAFFVYELHRADGTVGRRVLPIPFGDSPLYVYSRAKATLERLASDDRFVGRYDVHKDLDIVSPHDLEGNVLLIASDDVALSNDRLGGLLRENPNPHDQVSLILNESMLRGSDGVIVRDDKTVVSLDVPDHLGFAVTDGPMTMAPICPLVYTGPDVEVGDTFYTPRRFSANGLLLDNAIRVAADLKTAEPLVMVSGHDSVPVRTKPVYIRSAPPMEDNTVIQITHLSAAREAISLKVERFGRDPVAVADFTNPPLDVQGTSLAPPAYLAGVPRSEEIAIPSTVIHRPRSSLDEAEEKPINALGHWIERVFGDPDEGNASGAIERGIRWMRGESRVLIVVPPVLLVLACVGTVVSSYFSEGALTIFPSANVVRGLLLGYAMGVGLYSAAHAVLRVMLKIRSARGSPQNRGLYAVQSAVVYLCFFLFYTGQHFAIFLPYIAYATSVLLTFFHPLFFVPVAIFLAFFAVRLHLEWDLPLIAPDYLKAVLWKKPEVWPRFAKRRVEKLLGHDLDIMGQLAPVVHRYNPVILWYGFPHTGTAPIRSLFPSMGPELDRTGIRGLLILFRLNTLASRRSTRRLLRHEAGHIAFDHAYPARAKAKRNLMKIIKEENVGYPVGQLLYNAFSDHDVVQYQLENGYRASARDLAEHTLSMRNQDVGILKADEADVMMLYLADYMRAVVAFQRHDPLRAWWYRERLNNIYKKRLPAVALTELEKAICEIFSPILLDQTWTNPGVLSSHGHRFVHRLKRIVPDFQESQPVNEVVRKIDKEIPLWGRWILSGVVMAFFYGGYGIINRLNAGRSIAFRPEIEWLDAAFPFVPIFSYPYVWCLLVPFSFWLFLRTWRQWSAYFAGTFAFVIPSWTIFLLFPAKMIRPDVDHYQGALHWVRWIYENDLPYNIFPSLHAAAGVYVTLVFFFLNPKLAWRVLLVFPLPIAAVSTLLIKQHYFLDVVFGAALGWMGFAVFKWVLLNTDGPAASPNTKGSPGTPPSGPEGQMPPVVPEGPEPKFSSSSDEEDPTATALHLVGASLDGTETNLQVEFVGNARVGEETSSLDLLIQNYRADRITLNTEFAFIKRTKKAA